jgi:hypothetical protein
MTSSPLRINWTSIVIASMSVWVLSFTVVAATIFAYAFSLGWAAAGAPGFAAIQSSLRLCFLNSGGQLSIAGRSPWLVSHSSTVRLRTPRHGQMW